MTSNMNDARVEFSRDFKHFLQFSTQAWPTTDWQTAPLIEGAPKNQQNSFWTTETNNSLCPLLSGNRKTPWLVTFKIVTQFTRLDTQLTQSHKVTTAGAVRQKTAKHKKVKHDGPTKGWTQLGVELRSKQLKMLWYKILFIGRNGLKPLASLATVGLYVPTGFFFCCFVFF